MAATIRFMAKIESKVVGGHDQCALGMLQRRGKAAAHHIAQHIEDHHVRVFQQVVLLEQLHGLADHVTATACASRRSAGLDAHDAVVAFVDEVLGAQFLGVEVDLFEHVDDRWHQLLGEREGRVVLRITADLQHALAQLGKGCRQVGGGGGLADTALAVDGEHFRRADVHVRIKMNLDAAFTVGPFE
jgi:hypothetical protein